MAQIKVNSGGQFFQQQRQIAMKSIDKHMEFDSIFNLDPRSNEWDTKFLRIVRERVFYEDLNNQLQVSDDGYRDFICNNAIEFNSLKIYTSDFQSFNEATQNLKLQNLKTLEIVQDSDAADMISADFLDRCTHLQNIRLNQSALRFHMHSILKLETLKTLQIHYNEKDNKDDVLTEVISQKSASIKRLQAILEEFPPRWFRNSLIAECQDLEHLAMDMSRINSVASEEYIEKHMPMLKSLKKLWIVGDRMCMRHLMLIVDNCPNLEKLEIDQPDRVTCLNTAIKMKKMEERKKPLKIVLRTFVVGNSTRIDFK